MEKTGDTTVTIAKMLSELLASLGFTTLSVEALERTDNETQRRFARVILRDLDRNRNANYREVLNKFKLLRLA